MKIELTADWILDRFSEGTFTDGFGNASLILYDDELTNYYFLELAFQQMGIKYETGDYYNPNNKDDGETRFEFKICDIKEFCPIMYKKLKEQNYRNSENYKRKQKLNKLEKL